MKKRVLSFLMACFMVVSTFIISRPLVDVHAVENEALETWNLPTDWTTGIENDANGWNMPYKGVWKLLGYTDLDTATPKITASTLSAEDYKAQALKTGGHGKLPGPYLATNANETAVQTTNQSIYDSDGWYVNWNQRWSGKVFGGMATTVGNGIYAIAHANKPGAITFTAPSNGLYSYTETVEQVLFLANSTNLTFDVTVRKNGLILTKFSSSEANKSATLAGEVYLETGDKLMFAFQQTTSVTFSSSQEHKSNDPNCLKVTDLVVKKISDTTTNYSMPLTWNNECEKGTGDYYIAKQGDWRLTSFNDPSDKTTLTWNGVNQPWMNNAQNVSGRTGFYLNNGGKYANGTIFNTGVEGEYLLAIPYGTHRYDATKGSTALSLNSNPTALFTAPVSGEYAYSEILRGVTMTDANGTPVTVTATVRKNGTVLDTVTISADNAYACNAGTVSLDAGDFLMFVFVLDQQDALTKDHTDFIRIYGIDVALVEAAPVYDNPVELQIIFDGTSFTDKYGMVELMGYDCTTGAPYKDGIAIDTYEGKWYVYEPDGKSTYYGNTAKDNYLWGGTPNGAITSVGGDFKLAGIGSALVFTAPYAGAFKFESTMTSSWPASQKGAWSEYIIQKADGTVLDTDNNVDKGNNYGTNTNATTVSATVTLEKGEKVYIIRRPTGDGNVNVSCGGGATITITDLDHTCSSETVKHFTAVSSGCEDGNIEYYLCSCGTVYADANATETITGSVVLPGTGHAAPETFETSATQHWQYCANGCGEFYVEKTAHTWENGKCTVCEYKCAHENANVANCVTASICPVCAYQVAPINPNVHATVDTVVSNGNGTHKHVKICCDADSVVTENCVYGSDNICDECGFDGTALKTIESNKNNAFDNVFNGGNNSVNVTGPSDNLPNHVTKVEGDHVSGVEYAQFNIHHVDGKVTLRHHFIIATGTTYTITVNGNPVTLINVKDKNGEATNIWYFDTTPVVGKYDVADKISVNGTVTYSVSLYSYIRIALNDTTGQLGENEKNYLKSLYDLNEEAKAVEPVYVAMANQNAGAGANSGRTGAWIDIYDISTGNMNTPVWTYDTPFSSISGFKFRNHPTYGVVLLVTVGVNAEMVRCDTGEQVWSTTESSNNSHSIELLPNGVIVTGGTSDNTLTFFNPNGKDPSKCLLEFSFPDAHGVLWDPTHEVVWVVGQNKLTAYDVVLNSDGSITATKDEALSTVTPESGLHDLQPYYGNKNCLIMSTANHVYIYDTVTKTFIEVLEEGHVKGVGITPDGDMIYMFWDGQTVGTEAWNTTLIHRVDAETGVDTVITSDQGRFYKCRVLHPDYE